MKIRKETPRRNGTTKVVIDVALLKKIFYKYENYLVAVYTVFGPFKTGKFFLEPDCVKPALVQTNLF